MRLPLIILIMNIVYKKELAFSFVIIRITKNIIAGPHKPVQKYSPYEHDWSNQFVWY